MKSTTLAGEISEGTIMLQGSCDRRAAALIRWVAILGLAILILALHSPSRAATLIAQPQATDGFTSLSEHGSGNFTTDEDRLGFGGFWSAVGTGTGGSFISSIIGNHISTSINDNSSMQTGNATASVTEIFTYDASYRYRGPLSALVVNGTADARFAGGGAGDFRDSVAPTMAINGISIPQFSSNLSFSTQQTTLFGFVDDPPQKSTGPLFSGFIRDGDVISIRSTLECFSRGASAPFLSGSTNASGSLLFSIDAMPPTAFVPELDPGSMAGALTLLAGGVLTLTGRRLRK